MASHVPGLMPGPWSTTWRRATGGPVARAGAGWVCVDLHGGAIRGEPGCVVDEVGDDLLEEAGVGQHQRQAVGGVDGDGTRRAVQQGAGDDLIEGDGLQADG